MGRRPGFSNPKSRVFRKGLWSAEEDAILSEYIKKNGEGKWSNVYKNTGLDRCGKSCRLRWLNYLKPSIKKGNFSEQEIDLIFRLHKLLGNRWSLIAGRLPGRTDNEIKNYWNTHLSKMSHAKSECNLSKIIHPIEEHCKSESRRISDEHVEISKVSTMGSLDSKTPERNQGEESWWQDILLSSTMDNFEVDLLKTFTSNMDEVSSWL